MLPYISSPSLIGFHCPLVSFSLFLGIFLILMPSFPLFHHHPQYSSLLFQLHGHHFHHPNITCYHHSNYPIIVPTISYCSHHLITLSLSCCFDHPVVSLINPCCHPYHYSLFSLSCLCNHIILVYFLHHSSQIGMSLTKMSHSEPKFLLGHSYSICLVGFETLRTSFGCVTKKEHWQL